MQMSGDFIRLCQRLQEKVSDVRARQVIYVAFGDSVTQGCMEHGIIEHDQVYHNLLKRRIEQRYPKTVFNVINSGVSGDTVVNSRERWQRDMLIYNPDLVTIGFGVNDVHQGEEGLPLYIQSIRELINNVRNQTEADILLLTPNMMMKHTNPYIHENERHFTSNFLRTAKAGSLQMYTEALRAFVKEEAIPYVDVYSLWEHMEQQGIDIHTRLANGLNHPDREFHSQIAQAIDQKLFQPLETQ